MNDYFERLMDAIEKIERSIFKMNDLKREFQYEVNKLINRQALMTALVIPALFLIVYTINGSGMFSDNILNENASIVGLRMLGVGFITWTMGILLDFVFKYLFYRDYLPAGKTAKQQRLLPEYRKKKQKVIEDTTPILENEIIKKGDIPEKMINVPFVETLMHYLEEGRAPNLQVAVQLVQKEQAYPYSIIDKFKEVEQEAFTEDKETIN